MLRTPVYLVFFLLTGLLLILSTGMHWIEMGWLQEFSQRFFHLLCHQFYWRSFNSEQGIMAVCARCFGIYAGLFAGAVFIPVLLKIWKGWTSKAFSFLITAILLNIIDFAGNLSGIWSNTLYSRAVLGLLFGLSVAGIILTALYNQISKNYGTS